MPSFLILPEDVARLFERTVEETPRTEPDDSSNPLVKRALYAMGGLFGCLALAVYWPGLGIDDPFVRGYLAAFLGVFGLLFAFAGRVSA